MGEDRKKLPALIVPPAGYDLIDGFARANRLSKSEAVRQLLKESPRLVAYAQQHGVPLDVLGVSEWGGYRTRDGREGGEG
jgi:hypothetical protein